MDLIVVPDLYSPGLDKDGNYIDVKPLFHQKGVYCPCGARKDKVYETSAMFSLHIKSKKHQEWLVQLNLNKVNYYAENVQLHLTITNQQKLLACLENDVQTKILTIDYLTQQIHQKIQSINLLDFD